ncbi:hypothetical protein BST61_g1789 [Cercospora zeina]
MFERALGAGGTYFPGSAATDLRHRHPESAGHVRTCGSNVWGVSCRAIVKHTPHCVPPGDCTLGHLLARFAYAAGAIDPRVASYSGLRCNITGLTNGVPKRCSSSSNPSDSASALQESSQL